MIIYGITTIISLGLTFFLYHFFLKKEKTFQFNRFFLLGSLILCLLAPVLHFDMGTSFSEIPVIQLNEISSSIFSKEIHEGKSVQKFEQKHNWINLILFMGYCFILGLLLFRFYQNLKGILKRIKGNFPFEINGVKLILSPKIITPHSFFNYIFINESDYENQDFQETILCHERAHSKQFHSIDVVLMELLCCFFWFNPFLWMYKKAAAENHEFLADLEVMKAGGNADSYSLQLIQAGNKNLTTSLVSGFNLSQIKNRISMLYKKRSSKAMMLLKTGVVLGMFALVFVVIACSNDLENSSEPFVVVVDAGHGGRDPGMFNEKSINLNIAEKLAALSNDEGVKIILIRKKDVFIPLNERVKFAKEQHADLFLSLHCNASQDRSKSGVEAYYFAKSPSKEKSYEYSKIVVSNYLENISEKGEIKTSNFLVLRKLDIPAILLELGYLSNKVESQKLQNPEFQQKIAENIYKSLEEIRN